MLTPLQKPVLICCINTRTTARRAAARRCRLPRSPDLPVRSAPVRPAPRRPHSVQACPAARVVLGWGLVAHRSGHSWSVRDLGFPPKAQPEAILGGATTVDLLRPWVPLYAVAEFGTPTITIALAWVLLVRGRKGFGWEREGGEKKCPQCWCR